MTATTGTQTLADFLLARIAEDEAVAQRASWFLVDFNSAMNGQYGDRFNPARVLAECGAKRRIVEFIQYLAAMPEHMCLPDQESGMRLDRAAAAMAAVYADHPDYREEWQL